MSKIHFLNVKEGDCSWIEHDSKHNTIIDISNAYVVENLVEKSLFESVLGNYNQKNNPTNPIQYFHAHNMEKIFRFILTHPDMDHMDGLKALLTEFKCYNFWDTPNEKQMDDDQWKFGKYSKDDWEFYQKIRSGKIQGVTVLNLLDGAKGVYYNLDDDEGHGTGDGLYVLSPTEELVEEANKEKEYNNISYVILYVTQDRKILFPGDTEEAAWDSLLERHEDLLRDIDVFIAPHHGRKSGGNDNYLGILKPKLTLFGNAKSKDLDYDSWLKRDLDKITNNQAGNIVLCIHDGIIDVYVENEKYAEKCLDSARWNAEFDGYLIGRL